MSEGAAWYGPSAPSATQLGKYDTLTRWGTPTAVVRKLIRWSSIVTSLTLASAGTDNGSSGRSARSSMCGHDSGPSATIQRSTIDRSSYHSKATSLKVGTVDPAPTRPRILSDIPPSGAA